MTGPDRFRKPHKTAPPPPPRMPKPETFEGGDVSLWWIFGPLLVILALLLAALVARA